MGSGADKHFQGLVMDVSPEHTLREAVHRYIEPDNTYLLRNEAGVEAYDYLYSSGLINRTKYFRILLYEWFIVVKDGGRIIIDFEDNRILDSSGLMEEIGSLNLLKGRHMVEEQELPGGRKRVVIRKIASVKKPIGEIERWTFGVVTNGKRKEFIEKTIKSVRDLRIPYYEIILCGKYYGGLENDLRYIEFTDNDDKGWITKKKNLICENASYENIVIVHDRINFDINWFDGMKKWGPYYDVLSCFIYYPSVDAMRVNWDTMGYFSTPEVLNRISAISGSLEPTDWDRHVFIGGPIIILKKSVWRLEKWNECLFWGESEDMELSHRQTKNGILLRFNPFIKVYSEIVTVALFSFRFEKKPQGLGRFSINPVFMAGMKILDAVGLRRNSRPVKWAAGMINRMQKTRNWKREADAGAK